MEAIHLAATNDKPFIIAINKRDAVESSHLADLVTSFWNEVVTEVPNLASALPPTVLSCREAQAAAAGVDPGGIHSLTDQLVGLFKNMTSMPTDLEDLLGVTERQRQLLETCRAHLEDFSAEAAPPEGFDADIVLAAEHLRYAANALARITGRGDVPDVEDVLGVIFEK
jgi:tRNA modification GTPase